MGARAASRVFANMSAYLSVCPGQHEYVNSYGMTSWSPAIGWFFLNVSEGNGSTCLIRWYRRRTGRSARQRL